LSANQHSRKLSRRIFLGLIGAGGAYVVADIFLKGPVSSLVKIEFAADFGCPSVGVSGFSAEAGGAIDDFQFPHGSISEAATDIAGWGFIHLAVIVLFAATITLQFSRSLRAGARQVTVAALGVFRLRVSRIHE